MKIETIDIHHSGYLQLAQQLGGVFHQPEWLKLFEDSIRIAGIFDNDHKIIGAFHYSLSRKIVLKHLKTTPFNPHCGLFYVNRTTNKANALSFEKKLHQHIIDYLIQQKAHLITLAFPCETTDSQPYFWNNFKVVPFYTYIIDLAQSESQLLASCSAQRRNDFKKAERDGVKVQLTHEYNEVLNLVLKTFNRKSATINQSLLQKILFSFANSQNSFAYVAYLNNHPVAASFCIHDSRKAYYLLGGYDAQAGSSNAGALSLWNCILHAKQKGLQKFDFEGSMIEEVEKYMRGFGPELCPYYMMNRALIPIEIGLKFLMRNRF
jgi:hypothetical protein